MADVVLRSAEAADIARVLSFWRIAAGDAHRPPDTAAALATLHLRDPDALILAVDKDGDEIVGTVISGWDGWRCHLYRLAIAPSRRREGIGRALLISRRGPVPRAGRHAGRRHGPRRQRAGAPDLARGRIPPSGRVVPLDQAAVSGAGSGRLCTIDRRETARVSTT